MIRHASFSCLRVPALLILLGWASACSLPARVQRVATTTLLRDSVMAKAHIGICLYEPATGRYWMQHQAAVYFVPGSCMKLFTLYAALHTLGDSLPALRWRDAGEGAIEIRPTGDPTLLSSRFTPQPAFDWLRRQSRVWVDWPSAPPPFGKGWAWDDFTESFMPARSPLPLYENKLQLRRQAANGSIQYHPSLFNRPAFQAQGGPLFPAPGPDAPVSVRPFANDAATALALLQDTLPNLQQLTLTTSDEPAYRNRKFSVLYARPLDSVLIPLLHRSDNFYAEQLLLMAAGEKLGEMQEGSLIDTLLNHALPTLPDRPVWVDGSGLSRYNLVTPRTLVALLDSLQRQFGLPRMQRLLPTGGQGTLKNYFHTDSSYIFAKTGTLSNQSALSGYLLTRRNKTLIFSVLINNAPGKSAALRNAVALFLGEIRRQF